VTVEIPYQPRTLQREVGRLCRAKRFVVLVCHRRFGKTVLAVNLNQQTALMSGQPRPRTAYIGPTYKQAKAIAWDYMQHYARPIPGVTMNQSELRIDYPNEGQSRIYGADNPDSLRGIYLDRANLDEFGLHPPKTFSEVIGPTLVDRGGSALFLGTPNGKNQFYDIAQHAKAREAAGDPEWAYREYKASQTGLLDPDYLRQAREMMTNDEYAQEFECSFEASVKGAIYAKELEQARTDGRIGTVPIEPALPVHTAWDIGMSDHTAIWFVQQTRTGEVRVVDYYEASGEGLPFYAKLLKEKGYTYGRHIAPHDIQVRDFSGSGRSRQEVAREYGIRFEVAPKLDPEDGIHAARMLLPRCVFDATRCAAGIEALKHYRRDYNSRLNEFKATPVHDWASHGADAFRYLATTLTPDTPAVSFTAPTPKLHRGEGAFMAF
jgi:phage terminase large subunit